jgi:1,4-dihydroxy-2-naphthoate octaprenyltransferase
MTSDKKEPDKEDIKKVPSQEGNPPEGELIFENEPPESPAQKSPGEGALERESKRAVSEGEEPKGSEASQEEYDDFLDAEPEKAPPGFIKSFLGPWWQASRPSFYIATIFPLVLGLILAMDERYGPGDVSISVFIMILVASFLVHLATNICNDYFEHRKGIDKKDTIGGSRVLQEGKISPRQIMVAIFICYAAAFVLALFIVGKNYFLWGLVVFAALSSFFYVAPPVRYGHRALGELMVFLNMGLIMVVGTFIALKGSMDHIREVIAIAFPTSFMVASILYFQSLPEIETDLKAGKKTLANSLGKEKAGFLYLLWYPAVWLVMLILYLTDKLSPLFILGLLSFPLHLVAHGRILKAKDWLLLDKSGYLVKLLYIINNLAVILAVCVPLNFLDAGAAVPAAPAIPAAQVAREEPAAKAEEKKPAAKAEEKKPAAKAEEAAEASKEEAPATQEQSSAPAAAQTPEAQASEPQEQASAPAPAETSPTEASEPATQSSDPQEQASEPATQETVNASE